MGKNKIKVTVIIPIYNVEKYIERCARSLFEQTLRDIEYIFVNDCTPDKSIEVLERIIEEYPHRKQQVRILHHDKNKGLPTARNTGLAASKGEYIAHCDSDDWAEPTMYEDLYIKAIENNADIVCSDFFMNTLAKQIYYPMVSPQETKENTIKQYISYGWNVIWNMIVKSDLYKNNNIKSYDGYSFTEDYGLTIRLVYYANTIIHVKKAYYHYNRENQSSIVHQELNKDKREKMIHDEVSICCMTNEFLKREGTYDTYEKELSWRMLKAKRGWLYDRMHWKDYEKTYPQSNKYLKTNPFVSRKDKLCQYLFLNKYTRPLIILIVILDHFYKKIKSK